MFEQFFESFMSNADFDEMRFREGMAFIPSDLLPKRHAFNDPENQVPALVNAAQQGQTEAMILLSKYALQRGAFVEAYHWARKARLAGDRVTSARIMWFSRRAWILAGAPP